MGFVDKNRNSSTTLMIPAIGILIYNFELFSSETCVYKSVVIANVE